MHGIGLSNVRRAAEKYMGELELKAEQQVFSATVLLQERSQFFKRQRLFLVIAKSSIIIQVLIYDDSCQRLRRGLLLSLRQQHLDSIG